MLSQNDIIRLASEHIHDFINLIISISRNAYLGNNKLSLIYNIWTVNFC